jgi:hypothetical protein
MMLDSIITTATSVLLTTLGAVALSKLTKYIKEKERRELKKEAQQELHYLKLDAVIYALGNVGEHKEEFEKVYRTRLKNQLSEREDLQEIINQNS